MTEKVVVLHLVPRSLLLESDDLLAVPHAAQYVQEHELTSYANYLRALTRDLAQGLSQAAWARQIATEGDIALARRLAASSGSPDLDRFIEQQQQEWRARCQEQLQQSEQALAQASVPLTPEDERRISQQRERVVSQMREDHFHLAQRTLQQLTADLNQALQYAVQLQQERRDQAIKRVRATRDRYYEIALSHDTSKISEHLDKLLYTAERLALHSSLSDTDLQHLDRYCDAATQLCNDPTVSLSITAELIAMLSGSPGASEGAAEQASAAKSSSGSAKRSARAPLMQPSAPAPLSESTLPDLSAGYPAPPGGWTAEADGYVIDYYLSRPDEELAQHLQVPPEAVQARIKTLGLVGIRQADVRAPRGRELRQESWPNPYIPGAPITTLKMFYGRERDMEYIRSNLSHNSDEEQSRVVILEGHRRTGKTSLLRHLEGKKSVPSVLSPRIPIYLPIDNYVPFTSASLFYKMSYTIYQALHRREYPISQPRLADFQADFGLAWHRFLDMVQDTIGSDGLVLMFDEFQMIEERRAAGEVDKDVYWVLRAGIQQARHIDFILSGTMRLEEIVRHQDAALFGISATHILRSLDEQNARRLIREPVSDQKIVYDNDAVDLIVALTSSYPYYVQLLCHGLFNYLNDRQKRRVMRADVERVVPTVLEGDSAQFTSILFASDVSSLERFILAGAAELIPTLGASCHRDELFALLSEKKLVATHTEFEQALRQLTLRDLLKDGGGGEHIAFQIDLFRQWMRTQQPLDRLVRGERERQQQRRL